MTGPLHITNGGSAAGTLRATKIGGVVLGWDDALHVGPLPFEPEESRRARAAFLASHGWGDEAAIRTELERRDELLERATSGGATVVLWFEHDLFDQLQLLQILSRLAGTGADVELVQADSYLGTLAAAELEGLFPDRVSVDPATIALAREVWQDVCEGRLAAALAREPTTLPYVAPALRRLVEERAQPLSRTKQQLLRAIADGARTPYAAFAASQAMEEAIFLGDTWAFLDLHDLAAEGLVTPLPAPPPLGEIRAFAAARVELTAAGERAVSKLGA